MVAPCCVCYACRDENINNLLLAFDGQLIGNEIEGYVDMARTYKVPESLTYALACLSFLGISDLRTPPMVSVSSETLEKRLQRSLTPLRRNAATGETMKTH